MNVPMERNNFNFLRLLFALFVVITHAYPLSAAPTGDYLDQITHGQLTFSFIGLSGFFIISGYCVYQSLERSTSLIMYFWKRILRIFPALFVLLFLTVLLAPFVYDSGIESYLSNKSVWTYLPSNMTLFHQQPMISGVFTHNPYNPAINGSLWSLMYEFAFYIFLSVLIFIPIRRRLLIVSVVLSLLIVGSIFFNKELSVWSYILEAHLVLEFAPFFFFGALLAIMPALSARKQNVVLICLVCLLFISIYTNVFYYVRYLTLPPTIVLMGLRVVPALISFINKLGDISYGIYIYSFPIQQTLMYYCKFNALELMVSSLILSCIAGYLSWHLVEKKCLKYKEALNNYLNTIPLFKD
jgi:peptidoglycan/LPS O-acetylase OafA/YrhL